MKNVHASWHETYNNYMYMNMIAGKWAAYVPQGNMNTGYLIQI